MLRKCRISAVKVPDTVQSDFTGECVKLNKKLTTLQEQDTEIRTYEEKIHHLLIR